MSIQSEIDRLVRIKADLKAAINGSGSTVGDVFADYPPAVSNGRAGIAAAITEKGVQTPADAPFDVLQANVRAISSGGVQTELEIHCYPGEDYITAVSPYDSFSTASFGSKFLECNVGDLVYITCKTLQDFYNCEEISIPYEGPNPNPNFGDSKLLKITGEYPSVSAYY